MAFPQMNYSHCFSNMSTGAQLSPSMPPSMTRTSSGTAACAAHAHAVGGGGGAASPSSASAAAAAAMHSYPHQFGALFPQLHHPEHATCAQAAGVGVGQHPLYAPPPPYSTAAGQNPYFPIGAPPDATSAFYHSLGHSSSYGLKDGRSDSAVAAAAAVCRGPPLTQTPYPYDHAWAHAYHYPSNSYSIGLDGSRRKNATRESTATLKAWLQEHIKNPYPTKGEKIMLAIITKMTLTQVSTWFANARRRLKKENKMTWCPKNKPEDGDDDEDDADVDEDMGTGGGGGDAGHCEPSSAKERKLTGGKKESAATLGCNAIISGGCGQMKPVSEDSKGSSFKHTSHEEVLDQSSGSLEVDLSDVGEPSVCSEPDQSRAKIWRLAPPCSSDLLSSGPANLHGLYNGNTTNSMNSSGCLSGSELMGLGCYPVAPPTSDPSRRMSGLLSAGLYHPHHDLQQAAQNMAAHMHAAMVDKAGGY